MKEQTLSIIKPDAVERSLENKIRNFFTENNLTVLKSKKVQITKEEASDFYKVHQTKPFYNDLCAYLSSGPIVVMVLEGENAILKNRELMGATDPTKASEGTLRKMYGVSIDKNSVHGSDSKDNAKIEINFFFK
jgi:nucleoside-diphosphate kinase